MSPKISNNKKIAFLVVIFIIALWAIITQLFEQIESINNNNLWTNKTFRIIASSENKDFDNVIKNYANKKGYDIDIEYAGTLDIMQKLNEGEQYDAVWISNSIWLYMLDSKVKVTDSKYTSINPVIFGIKKSKAQELGLIKDTVYTQDIVDVISDGRLKFSMPNPTTTNSGASAYLGLLSTLAGNPEVLKEEHLKDEVLKQKLTTLFSGMERSSGSEEFLEELFLKGDYEAVVTYESSIISINQQLEKQGKETLYAIYPVDGVSISDAPFAYIDNKDAVKKEIFEGIQSYILSDEGQKLLQQKGRRTWYGGINNNVDKTVFNPNWGINTGNYISPVKYPNTEVIRKALNMYQVELRKPVHVVFCLDYSGSMAGDGHTQLMNAMDYILTDKAANNFVQFSEKDKIDVIAFGSDILGTWSTTNGADTSGLLTNIQKLKPKGRTALYPAAIQALELLKNEDKETYNLSVVLMTDGQANMGTYGGLKSEYNRLKNKIPIYSIMFGEADEYELNDVAYLTNGYN